MTQGEISEASKSVLEAVTVYAQKCLQANPVLVIGSGASIPYSIPGMADIQQHLIESISTAQMTTEEVAKWSEFTTALNTTDLESALLEIRLGNNLTAQVVSATWKYIGEADRRVFHSVLADRHSLALTRLYQHLFRSSNTLVHVVTTNYDRLAEYAANAGGFRHYVGFSDGYLGVWNDQLADIAHYDPHSCRKTKIRTVCVWKVHGSLDWFQGEDVVPVTLPLVTSVPDGFRPLIVTPGIDKYENTHYEPFRSVLALADGALVNSTGFFCFGYGFNDKHIQPKLIERCYQDRCPVVIQAKELTPAARDFISNQQCREFLAIEQATTGCRVYSNQHPSGQDLPERSLWNLPDLLSEILTR